MLCTNACCQRLLVMRQVDFIYLCAYLFPDCVTSTIRHLYICDHNKGSKNISNFYWDGDLQLTLSLPEEFFPNLFKYMAGLPHLPGPSQILLPLLMFSDFSWSPLTQWFPNFPILINRHHSDPGRFSSFLEYKSLFSHKNRNTKIGILRSRIDSHATKTSSVYHSSEDCIWPPWCFLRSARRGSEPALFSLSHHLCPADCNAVCPFSQSIYRMGVPRR